MKNTKFNIIIFLIIILLLSILKIYRCPIKYIFGLSCPTCGLTRAIISAFQLKFTTAFYYHLFWPVVIIGFIIYFLNNFKTIINKKIMMPFLYIFCFFNVIYYFYRLFNGSNIVYFDFTESLLYKIIGILIK